MIEGMKPFKTAEEHNQWMCDSIKKNKNKSKKLFTIQEKYYLLDMNLWEEKITCGPITFYRRSIRRGEFLITKYSFIKGKGRIMRKHTPLPPHYIYQKEIDEEYGGNKWMVPINRTFRTE